MFDEPWVHKLIFSLGISNAVLMTLVFLTCRCVPMTRVIGPRLMKFGFYQRFYKVHCYLWPFLWASVIVHAIFAIGFFGNPF